MDVSDTMPLDALFDIASMTKPLTAVAALMLYEEGRITLGDSVSAHIPELKSPMVLQGVRRCHASRARDDRAPPLLRIHRESATRAGAPTRMHSRQSTPTWQTS